MTTMTRRAPLAAIAATLGASAMLAFAAEAPASVTDRPCNTQNRLVKKKLYAKVSGRRRLLGKVYVFDEGSQLCAVTTSVGTAFAGTRKYMSVALTHRGRTERDAGRFGVYAGRVRIADNGGCFVVHGTVKLDSGAHDDAYGSCSASRRKPMP